MFDFLTGTTRKLKRTITTKHTDKRGLILTTYIFIDGIQESKKELILK